MTYIYKFSAHFGSQKSACPDRGALLLSGRACDSQLFKPSICFITAGCLPGVVFSLFAHPDRAKMVMLIRQILFSITLSTKKY